jgi:hypothetical protein
MKLAVIFVLLASALAAASRDAPTRTVTGIVKDQLGNALPKAVVEIENTKTMAVASYITQADGRYYFHQLSSEIDYTVRAKYRNLWSKSKLLDKFHSGNRITIDLEIPTK